MEQIQRQMFVTGRLYCDFEVLLVKESVTIRISKDFNYKDDVVPKHFLFLWWSYCSWVIVPVQKILKLKESVKSKERVTERYWDTCGKVFWLQDDLKLVV